MSRNVDVGSLAKKRIDINMPASKYPTDSVKFYGGMTSDAKFR